MYLVLFGFTTFIWCFEFISHFITSDFFIVFDVLNCLQGIVIFVVFVLEKNTRTIIVERFNLVRGKTGS
jgi:hypothetical protein